MRKRRNPEPENTLIFDFGDLRCPSISIEISAEGSKSLKVSKSLSTILQAKMAEQGLTCTVSLTPPSISITNGTLEDAVEKLDACLRDSTIEMINEIVSQTGRAYSVKFNETVEEFNFNPANVSIDMTGRRSAPLKVSNNFGAVAITTYTFEADPLVPLVLDGTEFNLTAGDTFADVVFDRSTLQGLMTLCSIIGDKRDKMSISSESVAYVYNATVNGSEDLTTLLKDKQISLNQVFTGLDIAESGLTAIAESRSRTRRKNPAEESTTGIINAFSSINEDSTSEDIRQAHEEFNSFLNDYFKTNFDNDQNLAIASSKSALLGKDTKKLFSIIDSFGGMPVYSIRLSDTQRDFSRDENYVKAYKKIKFLKGTSVTYVGNIALPDKLSEDKEIGDLTIANVAERPITRRADARGRVRVSDARSNPALDIATQASANSAATVLLSLMGVSTTKEGKINIAKNTDFLSAFYLLDAVQMIENRFLDHSSILPPSLYRPMAEVIAEAGVSSAPQKTETGKTIYPSELYEYLYSFSDESSFSVVRNILDGEFNYVSSRPKEAEITLSAVPCDEVEIYLPIIYSYIRAQTEPLNILLTVNTFRDVFFGASRSNPAKSIKDLAGPFGTLTLTPDGWRQEYFNKLHEACGVSPSTVGSVVWSTTEGRRASDSFINTRELEDEIDRFLKYHDAGLKSLEIGIDGIIKGMTTLQPHSYQRDFRMEIQKDSFLKQLKNRDLTAAFDAIDVSKKTSAKIARPTSYDFEGSLRFLVCSLSLFIAQLKGYGLFSIIVNISKGAMHTGLSSNLNIFGNAITATLASLTEYKVSPDNPKDVNLIKFMISPEKGDSTFVALRDDKGANVTVVMSKENLSPEQIDEVLGYKKYGYCDGDFRKLPDQVALNVTMPRSQTNSALPLLNIRSVFTARPDKELTLSFPKKTIYEFSEDVIGSKKIVTEIRIDLKPVYQAAASEGEGSIGRIMSRLPDILAAAIRKIQIVEEINLVTTDGRRESVYSRAVSSQVLNEALLDSFETDQRTRETSRRDSGTQKLIRQVFEGEVADARIAGQQVRLPISKLLQIPEFIEGQRQKKDRANDIVCTYETAVAMAGDAGAGYQALIEKYGNTQTPANQRLAVATKLLITARADRISGNSDLTGQFSYLEIISYSPESQNQKDTFRAAYTKENPIPNDALSTLSNLGVGLGVSHILDEFVTLSIAPKVTVLTKYVDRKFRDLTALDKKKLITLDQYFVFMSLIRETLNALTPREANYPIIWVNNAGGRVCAFSVVQRGQNYVYPTTPQETALVKSYLKLQSDTYTTCIGWENHTHFKGAMAGEYFFTETTVPGVMVEKNNQPYPFATCEWAIGGGSWVAKESRAAGNGQGFTYPNSLDHSRIDLILDRPRDEKTNLCAVATQLGFLYSVIMVSRQKVSYSSAGFSDQAQRISITGAYNLFYYLLTGRQMGSKFHPSFVDECLEMVKAAESAPKTYVTLLRFGKDSTKFYNAILTEPKMTAAFPALCAAYGDALKENPKASFESHRDSALKNISSDELAKDPVLFQLLTTNWDDWTLPADKKSTMGQQCLTNGDHPGQYLSTKALPGPKLPKLLD